MSKKEEYESKTERLLQPLIDKNRFELVDVEYVKEGGNYYLRAYIDKEGGITIDDCELISRALSDLLDKEDFIPDSYSLEVSSPGLGRQLKKEKDFKRSIGEEIELKFYKPFEKKKELVGVLEDFDEKTLSLSAEGLEGTVTVPRDNIASARLMIRF